MAIGVTQLGLRPLTLGRLSGKEPAATGVAGADRGFIGWSGAATLPGVLGDSGGGREDLVAQVPQGVMAAAGELAGDRQQRQLAIQAGLDLLEVGVIGRAGASGVNGGLIQCPAQQNRALSGQMPSSATAGGRVDRDIQSGVAHRVIGAAEPARVSHLGPDRHRGQRPNAVVCGLQRLGRGLPPGDPVDLFARVAQLLGEPIDLSHTGVDCDAGRRG